MRLLKDESGGITLIAAVSMTALFGFLGLAIDAGALRLDKQRMQMTADAAAMAAALEIGSCAGSADCTAMKTAAQDALTENGMTGSTVLANCASGSKTALTVSVNNGPCALGSANPHNGNTGYVEVVVSQPQRTYFAGILGIKTVLIQTRAEASPGASTYCLYALSTSGQDILVNGSAALTLPGCAMVVDSSSSSAIMDNGTITGGSSVGVVGSYTVNGGGTLSPTPKKGIAAVSDPLASLAAPSFNSSSCVANPQINSGSPTIGPATSGGTICYNGLTIQNNATVTLTPGLYIINGALLFNGTGSVKGTGVTFYFPSGGSYTDNGGDTLTLSAPLSGTYNGVLIYQNRSNSNQMIFNAGGASTTLEGVVYAPAANLTINGSGTNGTKGNLFTSLVTGSLTLDGSATFKDYSTVNSSSPLASGAVLEQ